MKKKTHLLLAGLLSVVLLVSCSSHDDSSTELENHAHDSVTSDDNSDGNKTNEDKQDSEENTNSDDQHKGDQNEDQNSTTEDETSKGDKEDAPAGIADQLKMKGANIKQPANFPVDGNVTANISKNTSSVYSIDYQTESDENIATVTGTLYQSANAAKSVLNEFMDGKSVPENEDTGKDLGHGIKGYGEGAAGHAYFSWEEGKWTMNISSLTEDQMNNPAIAQKMVDYLETHYLPAPKDTGIVSVDYPKGGNSVNVDIRWQEKNMVYQLKTANVPLDALKMATSVK